MDYINRVDEKRKKPFSIENRPKSGQVSYITKIYLAKYLTKYSLKKPKKKFIITSFKVFRK